MDARCHIELFGALRVTQGDIVHTRFRSHKASALLSYLALSLRQTRSREHLIEMFWPDKEVEVGRDNLSTALSQLRRQLEPTGIPAKSVLVADHQQVHLNANSVSTDLDEFDRLLKQVKLTPEPAARLPLLQRILELYRGDLLPGSYEEWAVREQNRCRTAYLEALALLTETLEEVGDLAGALATAQRIVEADPYEEAAYRALMHLHLLLDHPAAALKVYRNLKRLYRKEIGAQPSPETRALAELAQSDPRAVVTTDGTKPRFSVRSTTPAARAPVPATPAAGVPASDLLPPASRPPLPLQLTRLFGRQREREELSQLLLTPETRLVTVLGAGGVGKTRLAVAVAERLLPAFANRVWFVPLADVPDPSLIPYALQSALKLPTAAAGADPFQRVVEAVGTAPCLLVLDNFEHLLREAPEPGKSDQRLGGSGPALVRLLLERVPGLAILVTSRQALRLAGEQEFPLSPLPTPSLSNATAEVLLGNESVALYMDRARAVKPDFNLTSNNAEPVATLCRMLEGVPLAIEMAAAWARTLPPQGLVERLERHLTLLVSRQRDLPLRHRSLRATIEWSYDLLPPELRDFFAFLGVFRGGWTLAAAEAICGEGALEALSELQERSLVQIEERAGEGRYRLLEPLREFAVEQLQARQRWEAAQRRHADTFLAFAEEASLKLVGRGQLEWSLKLEIEHDNLRSAIKWYRDDPEGVEAGLRLTSVMTWFWATHGYLKEGRHHLAEALARESRARTKGRSEALMNAAMLACHMVDYAAAQPLYEECLGIRRELGDRSGIAETLTALGLVKHEQGDHATALSYLEERLAIQQEAGDRQNSANTFYWLGRVTEAQGDLAQARVFLEAAYTIDQEAGQRAGYAQWTLGDVLCMLGDYATARTLLIESLKAAWELSEKISAIFSLEYLAWLAHSQGQSERAARLYGTADVLRATFGYTLSPSDQNKHVPRTAAVRAALGEASFTSAWETGRAMTLVQATEYALEVQEP